MEATDGFVQVRGLTFHYRDWGGTGRPIVLLHGLASNARFWDLAAPFFADFFRTVALDQRGHGISDKPEDGYDFPTVAADVHDFTRVLGLASPIIVGHSWGGNVAVQVGADYPALASGIVCIDGGIIEPASVPGAMWEETEKRLAPPDFAALDFTWDQFLARARGWETAAFWGERLVDFLRANFDLREDGKVRPKLTRERHLRIVRALWEQRVSRLYSMVQCPVLLMPARRAPSQAASGSTRPEVKEAGVARATQLLRRYRVVWMEDSIHDVPLQHPAEVANTVIQAAEDGFFGT